MIEGKIRPGTGEVKHGLSRYHYMPWPIKAVFLLGPVAAVILFILHWFAVPVGGEVLASARYYYLIFAALGFNIFIGLGATRRRRHQAPPWYDYLLAAMFWGCIIYFEINFRSIDVGNWETPPGTAQAVTAVVTGILSIEAGRRIGGWGFVAIMILSIIYPLIAESMPGPLYGISFSFSEVLGAFAFGKDGMLGLPGELLGGLVLGFYIFAGVMGGMGGGEFFLKLATSLLGHVRGGPAKVAVVASGFFGSLSGSIIANIAGTGAFTIPAMKRLGYSPEYAAAVEANASTGGDTMPPIMGGVVFFMCVIAGVEYVDAMIAAFIPTLLHYFALFVQVDSYAARQGLRGMPRKECPPLGPTLLGGWPYISLIVFLVFGLVYMRWGAITPIYAVGVIIVLQFGGWIVRRITNVIRGVSDPEMSVSASLWRGFRRLEDALAQAASLINYGAASFFGAAFILVGLLKTGMAAGLTNFIVSQGGENVYLILFISVAFCLVMGMVGLGRSAYTFLAITAAPAIVALGKAAPEFAAVGGISVIGIHLFLIMYFGYGGLTPPVALHAFVAAGIAGADPIKTSYTACRMGMVLALFPFFFVMQPALLIINTPWHQVLLYTSLSLLAVWWMASGIERYLFPIGRLRWWAGALLIVGGFLIAFPQWNLKVMGFILCIGAIIGTVVIGRWRGEVKAAGS